MHDVFISAEMRLQIVKKCAKRTIRIPYALPIGSDIDGTTRQVHACLRINPRRKALHERYMRLRGHRSRLPARRLRMGIGKVQPQELIAFIKRLDVTDRALHALIAQEM